MSPLHAGRPVKRVLGGVAVPLLAVGWGLLAGGAAQAQAGEVGAIAASDADAEVLAHLETLVDARLVRRRVEHPDDLGAVLASGAGWPERQVVLVDRAHGTLHVLDTRDGTIVTRRLSDSVRGSPYAVAFVAAELLGLSAQLGEAAGKPAEDASGSAQGHDGARSGFGARGYGIGLGAELAGYPGAGVRLLRPLLDARLELGAPGEPLWLLVGVHAALLGSASTGDGQRRVELWRQQLGLRLGVGWSFGAASVNCAVGFGLDVLKARAVADPASADTSLPGWLGLGLGLRYRLIEGLAIFGAVDARWTPLATRYEVGGTEAVAPGRTGLFAAAGLAWDTLH